MEMRKLFESKKKVTAIGAPDVQIVFMKGYFIQYEQIMLVKNFRQYLQTILISSKVLIMDIQETPYQRTYDMQVDSQDFTVDFIGSNRQFDWIEISLVNGKSDKHLTIYDSYHVEYAVRLIKLVDFTNISDAYSVTNTKKVDTSKDLQKFLLYKQLVAWYCNGCTIAVLTDYVNNPIFQELYVDLRDSLGYTDKIEKPSRNNSKLTLTIEAKNPLIKKKKT